MKEMENELLKLMDKDFKSFVKAMISFSFGEKDEAILDKAYVSLILDPDMPLVNPNLKSIVKKIKFSGVN